MANASDNKMLVKFESKSNRVKGLSFHPVRPWILASLHNGIIQLWDYRMGTLLDKFEEHEGPVRGIDFHRTQPLICSGGDDYKVKVWDYKLRRCLYTLLGHLDYIRTVQFHPEYPWVVSASDDQTIRIWNWQSRSCISVLTGHNHYVMCACFHPKEDLIVSASLDQTVRVWDTTGLRKKTVRGVPQQSDDGTVVARVNNELFGGNDALVKYVLEGHERGVNWASFHPTLPLVASGADDRQVKLWRMNETKAWEVDTMRGHTNNVSCVLFHPKQEMIISNSEDRSIRVWDIAKRLSVLTFRKDVDRYWILAAHNSQNLLAAGHDSGMTVFKLERERPAFDIVRNKCYYVKDRYLRLLEFNNGKDVPLLSLRRSSTTVSGIGGNPRSLSYNFLNKQEHNLLVLYDSDGGYYELVTIGSTDSANGSTFSSSTAESNTAQDIKRGANTLGAVFIARDKFIVLDKQRQLNVKNLSNVSIKRVTSPVANVDSIYYGGIMGRVILRADDKVFLFDYEARRIIGELQINRCKYVIWNEDFSMIACLSKNQVILANKNLEQVAASNESVRVKGGCWDSNKPIFIYNTSNHVKYLISNNDKGILRGLDVSIYPLRLVSNTAMQCLDREGKLRTIEIDITEALFKFALEKKDYHEVMRMVKHSRLCGQSIIGYLQDKGYPEVALHFVQNNKSKFKLALACGNIQVAMHVANELGDDAWRQLGVEALRQGNHEVVEMSYQKTKEFERLSFLYLITGNTEKLRKMLKIAEIRGDIMSRFHNSLYLGDAAERAKVLELTGQLSLAYLTAANHGLVEEAERLLELLVGANIPIPTVNPAAELLQPPTPIIRAENWPLLTVTKPILSDILNGSSAAAEEATAGGVSNVGVDDDDFHDANGGANWGDEDDDMLFDDEEDAKPKKAAAKKEKTEGKGWGEEDSDLDLSDDEEEVAVSAAVSAVSVPESQPGLPIFWCNNSSHAAEHMAAGSVASGLSLLNRQIAVSNPAPLKGHARGVFLGAATFLPGLPGVPANRCYITRQEAGAAKGEGAKAAPNTAIKVIHLLDLLKAAYKSFTAGQFADAHSSLSSILAAIPFVVAANRSETNDLKDLVNVCREYITAIRVKDAMGGFTGPAADGSNSNTVRSLELVAYFTHCNLQSSHLLLALKTAMASAFKNKVSQLFLFRSVFASTLSCAYWIVCSSFCIELYQCCFLCQPSVGAA